MERMWTTYYTKPTLQLSIKFFSPDWSIVATNCDHSIGLNQAILKSSFRDIPYPACRVLHSPPQDHSGLTEIKITLPEESKSWGMM